MFIVLPSRSDFLPPTCCNPSWLEYNIGELLPRPSAVLLVEGDGVLLRRGDIPIEKLPGLLVTAGLSLCSSNIVEDDDELNGKAASLITNTICCSEVALVTSRRRRNFLKLLSEKYYINFSNLQRVLVTKKCEVILMQMALSVMAYGRHSSVPLIANSIWSG